MKWEYDDINVAERANIPKFSTLDDIVIPLRLLELFFDCVLVDMIFVYTKLCSHRKKADIHCVKSVLIRSYSGPYFPAFGLNTEKCGLSLRIQSECGKIQTRITPTTDTFHAVISFEITNKKIRLFLSMLLLSGCHKLLD